MLSINEVYHPGPIFKRHDWLMTRFLATDKDVLFCCAVHPFGVRADRWVGPVSWELGGILLCFSPSCAPIGQRKLQETHPTRNLEIGNSTLQIGTCQLKRWAGSNFVAVLCVGAQDTYSMMNNCGSPTTHLLVICYISNSLLPSNRIPNQTSHCEKLRRAPFINAKYIRWVERVKIGHSTGRTFGREILLDLIWSENKAS